MDDGIRKGRLQLILVGVVFLGPFLLAYFLYNAGGDWLPGSGTEHGELFQPPRSLPAVLMDSAGPENSPRLRGRWALIVVAEGQCDDLCREALYETRQIKRALGRESARVQRVICIESGEPDFGFLDTEHSGIVVLTAEPPGCGDLLPVLGQRADGDVFLADPLGNLVMRFPRETGMKGIHKDLKHLLKVSRIG